MIEFKGYISGTAENHFHKKGRIMGRNIMLVAVILILPMVFAIEIQALRWVFLMTCLTFAALIPLIVRIPNSKKSQKALLPKQIFIEDEYIVCVADKYEEYKRIDDVIEVRDFGEFYELVFPFGKVSEKFICQKNLLVQGSLEEFEALFDGKIIRIINK